MNWWDTVGPHTTVYGWVPVTTYERCEVWSGTVQWWPVTRWVYMRLH